MNGTALAHSVTEHPRIALAHRKWFALALLCAVPALKEAA